VSTSNKNGSDFSTTIELTHTASPSKQKHNDKPQKDVAWEAVLAIGVTSIAAVAVAETIVTYGAGFWNDIPAVGAAISAWANVF